VQAALPSGQPHAVAPQTYQASTAGELTYGKDKAHDMLKLKRQELNSEADGGLAQPQDVTGAVVPYSTDAICAVTCQSCSAVVLQRTNSVV